MLFVGWCLCLICIERCVGSLLVVGLRLMFVVCGLSLFVRCWSLVFVVFRCVCCCCLLFVVVRCCVLVRVVVCCLLLFV